MDKDIERLELPYPYGVRPKTSKKNPTTMRFTDEDRNILNQLCERTRLTSAIDVIRLAIRESLLHRKRKADALAYEEREDATKKELKRLRIERLSGRESGGPEDVLLPPALPTPEAPALLKPTARAMATCSAILPASGRVCPAPAGSWMYEEDPLCDPHAEAYRANGYELRRFL